MTETNDNRKTAEPPGAAVIPDAPKLETLASGYLEDYHKTYLRHLQEAVQGEKNRNIALTGRYGTGKSSVLDEFVAQRMASAGKRTARGTTLRIAISTLGPEPEAASRTLTNRIEKELVKQLLYRAAPREMPFSRFNRIAPLSWRRAALEATGAVAVVVVFLFLLGWLPHLTGTGAGHRWWIGALSGVGFATLAVLVLTVLRLIVHDRFVISDVSAAGATVKLTQRTSTYFDEYLDEIVYFFDEKFPEVVIFEDLDRFDDPHIFEALRELNTLLNHTAKRIKENIPLRFVYAIKDSLFETLGAEVEQTPTDAAYAETVRANRTKFFDVVIPVVPFISHRNARELLTGLLDEGKFTGIDRALVALVAQNATDMRLLKNIYNEYAVFAERLLIGDNKAPGLTPNGLFALVTYKNFHLKDFEDISRRESDLDQLYKRRRELVRATIDECEHRKRDLLAQPARVKTMTPLAKQLGNQLVSLAHAIKDTNQQNNLRNWRYVQFVLGEDRLSQDEVLTYDFWRTLAEADGITLLASTDAKEGQQYSLGTLGRSRISELFPEGMDAGRWAEIDERKNLAAVRRLDEDITFLRGASFKALATGTRPLPTVEGEEPFADFVRKTLKSKLACKLVERGYLDLNFALYTAQFYGQFSGVDVATFIVQSVQPNTMDIDYSFSGPDSIDNLLAEAPDDFLRTVSAYNTQVLDHLLAKNDERAAEVAATIAFNFTDHAPIFLKTYLNSGAQRERLAVALSELPWARVFTYLVEQEGLPDHLRPTLVSAALSGSTSADAYDLGDDVGEFIAEHYSTMPVFTDEQPDEVVDRVVNVMQEAKIALPSLNGVAKSLRDRIVRERLYLLTAENLREALGNTDGDISLDRLRDNPDVYGFCLAEPAEYLAAVESVIETTRYAVLSTDTLARVLNEVADAWPESQVRKLIAMSGPESRLEHLDSVPQSFWSHLATRRLFYANVPNVVAYRDSAGGIDQHLADLVVQSGRIDGPSEDGEILTSLAVDLLNAADPIPDPRKRVELVQSLHVSGRVTASEINPESSVLFALLLEVGLVEDSAESFTRIREAGWEAMEPAIAQSPKFVEFMTPALLAGFVEDLFHSQVVSQKVRDKVTDSLQQYVPDDDVAALTAAGTYASREKRTLHLDQVRRIARVTRDASITMDLLAAAAPVPQAQELVEILASLGEPYSYLTSRTESKFEVPNDDGHRKVFIRLKDEGVVAEFTKVPRKERRIVKLA